MHGCLCKHAWYCVCVYVCVNSFSTPQLCVFCGVYCQLFKLFGGFKVKRCSTSADWNHWKRTHLAKWKMFIFSGCQIMRSNTDDSVKKAWNWYTCISHLWIQNCKLLFQKEHLFSFDMILYTMMLCYFLKHGLLSLKICFSPDKQVFLLFEGGCFVVFVCSTTQLLIVHDLSSYCQGISCNIILSSFQVIMQHP